MAAKISKLEEQFQKDAPREKKKDGTSSCIFSDVAIYVNGYTGQISSSIPTTHVCCDNKCEQENKLSSSIEIGLLHNASGAAAASL